MSDDGGFPDGVTSPPDEDVAANAAMALCCKPKVELKMPTEAMPETASFAVFKRGFSPLPRSKFGDIKKTEDQRSRKADPFVRKATESNGSSEGRLPGCRRIESYWHARLFFWQERGTRNRDR